MTPIDLGGSPVPYPPDRGFLALRTEIAAQLLRDNGLPVDADNILITNGGTQAILVAQTVCKLLAEARDGSPYLHLLTPTWMKLPANQAKILGIPFDSLPLTFTGATWLVPPMPHFISGADVHMLFAVDPANPLGQILPAAELRCEGSFTVLDITYESMVFDGDGHLNLSDVAPYTESTFIVGSLSKTYAIPGHRIGFLVTPASLVGDAADVLTALSMGVSVQTQEFAVRLLRDWRRTAGGWFRPVRDELKTRASVVYETLVDLGFQLARPNAGYYAFASMPAYIPGSAVEFAQRLLRRGVRIVEGDDFGGPQFDRFIRISFGNAKSLGALREALGHVRAVCVEVREGA